MSAQRVTQEAEALKALKVIDRVCAAADKVYQSSLAHGSALTGRLLMRLAEGLAGSHEALLETAASETELSRARLEGELTRTIFQVRMFSLLCDSALLSQPRVDTADATRRPPRADMRSARLPIGAVAVFAASNFPFAFGVLGGDTASALAVGCPVIVMGHPDQPALTRLLQSLIHDALGPDDSGWLSVVTGGHDVGRALVQHPIVQAVAFTGSTTGGRAITQYANSRSQPIPVYAEMGSVNPTFVSPGAARVRGDVIASEWGEQLLSSAGQLCTKPGLLVYPDVRSARRAGLVVASMMRGVPEMALLSPRIADAFRGRATSLTGRASQAATEPVTASETPRGVRPHAFQVAARAVLSEAGWFEEVFGPAGALVAARSVAEQMAVARTIPGTLTATVHAEPGDGLWVRQILPTLQRKAGRLIYNGWPTGVSVGWATHHGGPWPATSNAAATSVGFGAADRFTRPVAYQGFPDEFLPTPLSRGNASNLERLVDGTWSSLPG